ncbi:hypothetical protein OAU50_01665 [Planctomycetota bacterium]|nr:hypothetical protein [Planctomycetota bacterium]
MADEHSKKQVSLPHKRRRGLRPEPRVFKLMGVLVLSLVSLWSVGALIRLAFGKTKQQFVVPQIVRQYPYVSAAVLTVFFLAVLIVALKFSKRRKQNDELS